MTNQKFVWTIEYDDGDNCTLTAIAEDKETARAFIKDMAQYHFEEYSMETRHDDDNRLTIDVNDGNSRDWVNYTAQKTRLRTINEYKEVN